MVIFTPQPLYPPGKSPRNPVDRRLSRLQSRSARCGEEKNLYSVQIGSVYKRRKRNIFDLRFSHRCL
jgi:hypothetical protein